MTIKTHQLGSTIEVWMKNDKGSLTKVSVRIHLVVDGDQETLRVGAFIAGTAGLSSHLPQLDSIETVYWIKTDQIQRAINTQRILADKLTEIEAVAGTTAKA